MVPPAASGAQAPAPPFPSSTTIQPSSLSRLTLSDKLLLSQAVHHIGSSPPDWARVSSVLLSHPLIKTKSRLEQAAKAGITLGRVFGSRECERAWVALMRQYNLVLQPGEKDLSIENESDSNNSPAMGRSKEARGLPPKMDRGSQLALAQFLYAERIREIQETIKAKEVAFKVLVDEIEKLNAGDLDEKLLSELEKTGKLREEAAEATAQQNAAAMAELAGEATTPSKADDESSADFIRRREEASRDTSASSTPLPSPRKIKGTDAASKAPSDALAPSVSNAESGTDVATVVVDGKDLDKSNDVASAKKKQTDAQSSAAEAEAPQTKTQESATSTTAANDVRDSELGSTTQGESDGDVVPGKVQSSGIDTSVEPIKESVDDKTNGKRKRLADQDTHDDSEDDTVQKRSKASESLPLATPSGTHTENVAAPNTEIQGLQAMEVDEEDQAKKSNDAQVEAKDNSQITPPKSESEDEEAAKVQTAIAEGSVSDEEMVEEEDAHARTNAGALASKSTEEEAEDEDEEAAEGDESEDDEDDEDEGVEDIGARKGIETSSATAKEEDEEDDEDDDGAEEQEDEDEEDEGKPSTKAKEDEDENDNEEESDQVERRPEPRRSRRSGRNMSIATDEPPTPTTLSAKNSRVEALRSREASGTSLEPDEERTEALADGLELDTSRSTNEHGSRTSMSPVSARRNGRGASRPSRRSVRGSSAGGSANAAAAAANDESAAGSDAERERAAERAATKDHRKMEKVLMLLLNEVSNHTHGNLFHAPIKESDAPDYYQLIRHPLDLKTIKSRIKEGRITTSTQLRRALMQMFANSLIYNRPGSDIHRMALEMRDAAEEMLDRFEQTQMSASATRR